MLSFYLAVYFVPFKKLSFILVSFPLGVCILQPVRRRLPVQLCARLLVRALVWIHLLAESGCIWFFMMCQFSNSFSPGSSSILVCMHFSVSGIRVVSWTVTAAWICCICGWLCVLSYVSSNPQAAPGVLGVRPAACFAFNSHLAYKMHTLHSRHLA